MSSPHTFHIPVMGTGFTLDSPLLVARYGISSVISLVDDNLIEKLREHYSAVHEVEYEPITDSDDDARARRITAYLDFIAVILEKQMADLRSQPFAKNSDITKYFELLDDESDLKKDYVKMLSLPEGDEKNRLQKDFRGRIRPGSVDVNIMTKQQREIFKDGEKLPLECSDTFTALRGYARSRLRSSLVFSAGLNPPLYSYVSEFPEFFQGEAGEIQKKIVLKVSDFRSALIQGKIFAKKGIWISEYRIESGLNCGGHAFPTPGVLLGPILEAFCEKREEMTETLFNLYRKALSGQGKIIPPVPPPLSVTVQGGIGTAEEDRFLRRYYKMDGTGWGTPFLLVPEATSVDEETLERLAGAGKDDVYLSAASPLGVPYYNLRSSASNQARRERLASGRAGTPCFTKVMTFNYEFGEQPLCVASSEYQRKKIAALKRQNLNENDFGREYRKITEKECICHNLGGSILKKHDLKTDGKDRPAAICPGPNLAYFSRTYSLKEMLDHIYGRGNVFEAGVSRPHVFIGELKLYIDYLIEKFEEQTGSADEKQRAYLNEFKDNLLDGIQYYENLSGHLTEESEEGREKFRQDLRQYKQTLHDMEINA